MARKARSQARSQGRGDGPRSRSGRRGQKDKQRQVVAEREAQQRERLLARFEGVEPDGRVVCQYGTHAEVSCADGRVRLCLLTPKVHKLFGVCVGDWVWTGRGATDEERIIEGRAERRTEVRRKRGEEDRHGHVIAANVDTMAITAALKEPPLRTGALDRYLVLASHLGLAPLLVLTKLDLTPADDPGWSVLEPYRSLGVDMVYTASVTGQGLADLRVRLAGRVTVFAGHSGVGKSRLCGALGLRDAPEPGDLSRSGGRVRGRHKTSVARLLNLGDGGWVVDTPGVRAIGLVDLERQDVPIHFPDLADIGLR
ncbi:MAG TPA: ribosome small subunit-dependent GTPase A, partial [Deltaproteobacteria bacterium]|nr:ribosome small subunit-dependent GTPase A [Deltaproteobacteria bacterium]